MGNWRRRRGIDAATLMFVAALGACSTSPSDTASGLRKAALTHAPPRPDDRHYADAVIVLERGAFHYDRFVLEGDSVRFEPNDKPGVGHEDKYTQPSRTQLSEAERDDFLWHLERNDFWELDSRYEEPTTCTSSLEVRVRHAGREKSVTCVDYQRSCPAIVRWMERELVRLHGHGLERVFLPG